MDKYFGYNIVDFDEFIKMYDFNSSIHVKSNDRRRLIKDFKAKKYSPLVRAFLVYLKMKENNDNNNNNKIIEREEVKEIVEEEEDESSEDEEGTVKIDWKPVKTPCSKQEMEKFTLQDFIASTEYKYLLEKDAIPPFIKNSVNNPDGVYWEGQYNNLKTIYKNLKNI